MDEELKQLAALALRNAFWRDFNALCNVYLEASEGLDEDQEILMGDLTSIYGRDDDSGSGDLVINIYTQCGGFTRGHVSLVEALGQEDATSVYLQGHKVFERRGDEWYFVDN